MPATLDAPKIFTPEYYQRMRELEDRSWWNAGMRDVARELLEQAALRRTGTMLDVGCGSGQTLRWFKELRPEWRTFGLDMATDAVAAARASGIPTVSRASALQLPLPSAFADLVVTLDVIQHLPLDGGDRVALGEFARVLKPGGLLFIRTNAQAFPHTADDPEFEFHKYEVPELRERLRTAGFDILLISRINALLGLAEIPRELKARKQQNSYHGILSTSASPSWSATLKRTWLRLEGRMISSGVSLPFGRSILALARCTIR